MLSEFTVYGRVLSAEEENQGKDDENKPKPGDVMSDNTINSYDYILVRSYILGIKELSEAQLVAADVNKDGNITSFDYLLLRAHILGLTTISGWEK